MATLEITTILDLESKNEILNGLNTIDVDYPEFDGDRFDTYEFSHQYETKNFLTTINGEFSVKWLSHEEYEFDSIENVSIEILDENSNKIENKDLFDTIEANLELGFGEDDRDYSVVDEIFKLGIKGIGCSSAIK